MSEQPYPFQERVARKLLAGSNVILQAPTGAGKTRAALLPWMHALHQAQYGGRADAFPWRCIYSVPMRVLAQQFVDKYREAIAAFSLEHGRRDVRAVIQTGEQPDDPRLENALIFATLDQTLSSALGIPYSLAPKMANLNAGAVMSSYLVWDEFHLFGRRQALPTTLHLMSMKMLGGVTPFCLMTATFSRTMLGALAEWLGAEIVQVEEAELEAIPSQRGKQRRLLVTGEELSAQGVLERFDRRALTICNTVDRAQQLYRDLQSATEGQGIEVKLLHSRFYQEDRRATTGWVQENFAEGWQEKSGLARAILVATQVVEVGMDITCQTLHSELAPANTLIQRAGRCARFVGESGEVIVHDLPCKEDGRRVTAPYDMEPGSDLCERTWQALQARNGALLRYADELELLEEVHRADDERLLHDLRENSRQHREAMLDAMVNHSRHRGRALIREVDNYALVIHPDPNGDTEGLVRSPWAREALMIPRRTFWALAGSGKAKQSEDETEEEAEKEREEPPVETTRKWLQIEEEELEWAIRYPVPNEDAGENRRSSEENEEKRPTFRWERANTGGDLRGQTLVAIHPTLVTYTKEAGLELHPNPTGSPAAERRPFKGQERERYGYELETYAEHIAGLWRAYTGPISRPNAEKRGEREEYPALRDEVAYSLPRMAGRAKISPETLAVVVRWMLATHDVGKLGTGWQNWVKQWQKEIGGHYEAQQCYAHTDNDGSKEHEEIQRQVNRRHGGRPPHAAESASACFGIFAALLGTGREGQVVGRALLTAIARHHGASHSGELQKAWQAPPTLARAALVEALARLPGGDPATEEALLGQIRWALHATEGVQRHLVEVKVPRPQEPLLYLWLSRLLRLADQRSLGG